MRLLAWWMLAVISVVPLAGAFADDDAGGAPSPGGLGRTYAALAKGGNFTIPPGPHVLHLKVSATQSDQSTGNAIRIGYFLFK